MRPNPCRTLAALAAVIAIPAVWSQPATESAYLVQKSQNFLQTSSAAPSGLAPNPFNFSYEGATASTVTPPGKSGMAAVSVPNNDDYEVDQTFASQAAMDAAFPDGSYQLSGSSIPTVSVSLTGDLYPAATPSISGGTWLPGGVLVLNPNVDNNLKLSNFTAYSSAGVGGAEELNINSITGTSNTSLKQQVATKSVLGITQSSTPFTSYDIPAGTLESGTIYQLSLSFDSLTNLDTTSISNGAAVAFYDKSTVAFIIAQSGTTATDTAPRITSQAPNQSVALGGSATFNYGENFDSSSTVIFGFSGRGLDINDTSKYGFATSPSGVALTVKNVAATDLGSYFALFVNPGGVAVSQAATLTEATPSPPAIVTSPKNETVATGSTVVLTAVADGASSYQWTLNGTTVLADTHAGPTANIIAGSTGPQLVITNATAASNGSYTVVATNAYGSSDPSTPATLTVASASNPGYLINISARAFVGTNSNIMIGGFYIVGSTSRSVLIQAIGPGLAGEGVTGVLQKPALTIHNSAGATIYSNTGWGSSQLLLNAAAAAYANPVLQPNSADSELLLTLPPGGYTAEIAGADGGTGVALCAIYQLP